MIPNVETDVAEVEANPVRSRHHQWVSNEKEQYDSMHWRGRTLYDNLRTQKDYSHSLAFWTAWVKYGGPEK